MSKFNHAVIELLAEDPRAAAGFYVRVFGFREAAATQDRVEIRSDSISIVIKRGQPLMDESSTAWGMSVRERDELDAMRQEAVAAGAVVLSETKRDQSIRVGLQDPAGNEFFVALSDAPQVTAASEALVVSPARDSAPQASHEVTPNERPTRRMIDQLMDKARLATMQETIAGLSRPFTADDPSFTLDEMRMKLGAYASEPENPDIARIEAEQKAKAADDLLATYKAQMNGGVPSAASPETDRSAPVPAPKAPLADVAAPLQPAEPDETRPIARTLGRAPDEDS